MSTFDNDEQKIYDSLSQISVDESSLARKVKERLTENTVRTDCTPNISRQKRKNRSFAFVTAMSIMLIIATAATALGNFQWFIDKFKPSFGEIVQPVGKFSEDQGIRMEIIGAKKYDNQAIVYLSLQDISGQNRLTEQTDFRDGFSVKMGSQAQHPTSQTGEAMSSSFSWKQEMLYFDQQKNTAYYQFHITASPGTPLSDPLELGSFLIYFTQTAYEYEPISVSLANVTEVDGQSIKKDHIWGGTNLSVVDSMPTEVLTPGEFAAMPHGSPDQWVSNVGILKGKLHIQIASMWNREFGTSDANIYLMDLSGNIIDSDYAVTLLGDADHQLLDLETDDYGDAVYKYNEAVFTMDALDLQKYKLVFTGSVSSGVEGSWKVVVNTGDTSKQMHIFTNDIPVEDHLFEHLTLSPLGLQVFGRYEGEVCQASDMSLILETRNDMISLDGGSGSLNSQEQTFNLHWYAEAPLDVTSITAIIINDTRIPLE